MAEIAEILQLVDPAAEPAALAVVDRSGRTYTRGELWEQATALARDIDEGVPPDQRVGFVETKDGSSVVALLATLLAERPVVMVPVEAPGADAAGRLAATARCGAVVRGLELTPVSNPAQGVELDPAYGVERLGSREAVVLYTSGTTSQPRGVRLSHRNVVANLTAMLRTAVDWDSTDRLGQVLSITHSFGLSMILLALTRRTPIVFLDDGPPSRRIAEAMAEQRVSLLGCVPYVLRLMARRGLRLGVDCGPDMRRLYLAGGGISDAELAQVLPGFSGEVFLMYGFTECTARVAVRRRGDGAPPDTVGLPLPGTNVEIVDRAGKVLPVGAEGRIRASSPSVMMGYLGGAVREPGTPFETTDLGRLDAAGNLRVTGREAEMLNFRGNRVSLVVVEAAVTHLDGVREARLQPESGDEDAQCALLLVTDPAVDHGEIRKAVQRAVTPRGLISHIRFVDHLETTRSGKPLRR